MSNLFFNVKQLLSGTVAPATGDFVHIEQARRVTLSAFNTSGGSGVNSLSLYYPSPFFESTDVLLGTFSITGTGNLTASISTLVPQIKAVSSGSGNFYAALILQD